MIVSIINKIKSNLWVIRYICPTLYFNFHYLPFRQAIHLPIFLYKPNLKLCKGHVKLSGGVRMGMIKLGKKHVSLYPNKGISWECNGYVEFKGACSIGQNSYLSIAPNGHIIFGDNFCATNSLRIASYNYISFGDNVLCGWECLFLDTDFHRLTCEDGSLYPKPIGKVIIGNNCWFALKCTILKDTRVPNDCVIAAKSLLNSIFTKEKCMLAGTPAKVIKEGVFLNHENDNLL